MPSTNRQRRPVKRITRRTLKAFVRIVGFDGARATFEEAEQHLATFAEKWDSRYPSIAKSWRGNWARVIPMFGFPDDIRRAVYTTNSIESLNMSLRKVIKTRASFPNDDAAFKLLYLALRNIAKKWTMPIPHLESGDAGICHHL
jgi:putative transposase